MNLKTISWKNNKIKIIDQAKLPGKLEYLYISNIKDLRQAIRKMRVRGAPALGIAGALGVYLGIKDFDGEDAGNFNQRLNVSAVILLLPVRLPTISLGVLKGYAMLLLKINASR